jgi:hypothetical protein
MASYQRTNLISAKKLRRGILAQALIRGETGKDHEHLRKELLEIDLLILRLEGESDLLKSRGWNAD